MRSLERALSDHELTILRVIGEWWELDLAGADKNDCVLALAERLAQLDMPEEMSYLPREDVAAFSELIANGGRMPVATFAREHGEVRLMGPGRLEREEPWLDPISPAEALWYRGFLYRGFDETAEGLIEFYFVPDELLNQFPGAMPPARPRDRFDIAMSPVSEPAAHEPAVTDAVDDLTTMLALAQVDMLTSGRSDFLPFLLDQSHERVSLLLTLASEMGLLRKTDRDLRPMRAAVEWLKQPRVRQLRALADAWSSSAWNELCHTPGLACEGEGWQNDPILARTALLDAFPRSRDWFRMDDLVSTIRQNDPDFQRPDGNYDTWYVRDLETNEYLKGFDNWQRVEGRLLKFLLNGPGRWLGLVDIASSADGQLYRLSSIALDWLANEPPSAEEIQIPLVVQASGIILVPFNANRYHRFQAARIGEPEAARPGQPYRYRLSPRSLARAAEQGIDADRIATFLVEASGRPLPASVSRAMARWAEKGVEARVEASIVLRVREAAILDTLRKYPKTRDYIGESLGDLAAVVRLKEWQPLVSAAAELGLLLDVDLDSD